MEFQADFFTQFRPSVEKALRGFTRCDPPRVELARTSLDRTAFPVPAMLLILLRNVMGFAWDGVGDKTLWTVYFNVGNKRYAVEEAKFGLRLHHEVGHGEANLRIVGQLNTALGRLEKRLEPFVKHQIELGNVTLANRSGEFQARYQFFRDKADAAYRSRPKRARAKKVESSEPAVSELLSRLISGWSQQISKQREGFYYSVAMTDAYFSYLEQRLVLLRAFTGRALSNGGVETILAKRWDEKLTEVLGPKQTTQHASLVGRLRQLKERIRNPFAHGGTENDGGSIFCHVPHVGAIPGNMSRTRHSTHFKWIPVESEDHQSVCQLFDEVDAALCGGTLAKPSLLADGGIDPVWSTEELKRYRKLVRGRRDELVEYIRHWNREQDRHTNMDY